MAVPTQVTPNGAAENGTGGSAGTFVWPTGTAVDDIGLLMVQTANEGVSLSTPNGWVEVLNVGVGTPGAAGATRLTLFWLRAASTTPPIPTLADPGDHFHCRILGFRGCINSENPITVISTNTVSPSSTAVSVAGGSNPVADSLAIAFVAHDIDLAGNHISGVGANPDLSIVTTAVDGGTATALGGGVCAVRGNKAGASAFQATTWTLDTAAEQATAMLLLRSNALPPSSGAAAAVILSEGY